MTELIDAYKKGKLSLEMASERGHLEFVKYLVSKGANVIDNNYAVQWASDFGHLEVVKYLVSRIINQVSFTKIH